VLPIVLGLLDGITNALGLAAHAILGGGSGGVGLGLALRVASFALVTAVFAIFVARYVELRTGLIRASRQLNLLDRGVLAATRLGRAARRDALADAAQASPASLLRRPSPAGYRRRVSRIPVARPLVLAISMLIFLGLVGGHRLGENPGLWAALAAAGIILAGVGAMLNIA